jgi:hypothetical protein
LEQTFDPRYSDSAFGKLETVLRDASVGCVGSDWDDAVAMSPDPRSRRKPKRPRDQEEVRTRPSPDDAHEIVYFRRHREDDHDCGVPAQVILSGWPTNVRAKTVAVLAAVAAAPPKRFAGGGYWQAMHGEMTGWFEVRVDGSQRSHYRLFCLLDYEAQGRDKPLLVVVDGRHKALRTTLSDDDYAQVRALGDEYRARNPRSVI